MIGWNIKKWNASVSVGFAEVGWKQKFGITGEEPGRLLEHFLPLSSFALNHRRLSTVLFYFLREQKNKWNEMKTKVKIDDVEGRRRTKKVRNRIDDRPRYLVRYRAIQIRCAFASLLYCVGAVEVLCIILVFRRCWMFLSPAFVTAPCWSMAAPSLYTSLG